MTTELFNDSYYFIVYSRPPFSRYANENKTSYFHDPKILHKIFSPFGKIEVTHKKNYIVVALSIESC